MIKLTSKNYDEVVKGNSLVLIDFFATWCGPCKMLSPVIEELDEENYLGVVICKVDVDEERELSQKFMVQSIPTLVVIKDGKPERKALGFRSKEAIKKMLEF